MNFARNAAGRSPPPPPARTPFNLSRWFAVVALSAISALAIAVGVALNWFVSARMVAQEAALTREFVHSLLMVETPIQAYIAAPSPQLEREMAVSFEHIARMPDVLRANIYDRQRRVIWSSDHELRGRVFGPNDELDRALAGEVVANRDEHDASGHVGKDEHQALRDGTHMFVEIYVPVLDAAQRQVIGAIEFYKRPQALARALAELRVYIAVGAALGGVLLFGALFGLVRRADRTIVGQQRQLVDQATLAALGEMSGAVAHGIRNPLASIRSSAELIAGASAERAAEAANDIVAQSDRLEEWVRELLSYTQPVEGRSAAVALPALVQRCLADFSRELEQRHIVADSELPDDLPQVQGDAMLMGQVLRSLVANAIEAMGREGRIVVRSARASARGRVVLEVRDSGPGLSSEQLRRVGQPFFTTKPRGLGVGLAMARRIIERAGGHLDIDSAPGQGTVVRLTLVTA